MYIFLFPRVKGMCDRSKEHQLNELSDYWKVLIMLQV